MSTHTVAELEVSPATYDEIVGRLQSAGWNHVFLEGGLVDMHGIALVRGPEPKSMMALNDQGLPVRWDISDDPAVLRLPGGTIVRVDGKDVAIPLAFDSEEGWVKAICTGLKAGCEDKTTRHLDEKTFKVCQVMLFGKVEVTQLQPITK